MTEALRPLHPMRNTLRILGGNMLPISTEEFDCFRNLIYMKSGISLAEHKEELLRSRLTKRIRTLGLASFGAYLTHLNEKDVTGEELTNMLDAVTTNLTGFFREPQHFDYLRDTFFKNFTGESEIRLLSAGCSSGEEPYSMAISALESLGLPAKTRVKILACDISTRMLARGRTGIYQGDQIKDVAVERQRAYFLKGTGSSEGLVSIAPEVRDMVQFTHCNINEQLPASRPYHAIFCRNVSIYFDQPTQFRLMERLHATLEDRGLLFMGHSESILVSGFKHFEFQQPAIYRRLNSTGQRSRGEV